MQHSVSCLFWTSFVLCLLAWQVVAQTGASQGIGSGDDSAQKKLLRISEVYLSTASSESFVELHWDFGESLLITGHLDNTRCTVAFITAEVSQTMSGGPRSRPSQLSPSFTRDEDEPPSGMSHKLVISQYDVSPPLDISRSEPTLTLVRGASSEPNSVRSRLVRLRKLVELPDKGKIPVESPCLIRTACSMGSNQNVTTDSVLVVWRNKEYLPLFHDSGMVTDQTLTINSQPAADKSYSLCVNTSSDVRSGGNGAFGDGKLLVTQTTPLRPNECVPVRRKLLNEISWFQVLRGVEDTVYTWGVSFVEVLVTKDGGSLLNSPTCKDNEFQLEVLLINPNSSGAREVTTLSLTSSICQTFAQPATSLLRFDVNTVIKLHNVSTIVPLVCTLLYHTSSDRSASGRERKLTDAVCMALLSGATTSDMSVQDMQQITDFSARFNLPLADMETFQTEARSFSVFSPFWSVIRCRCCQSFDMLSFRLTRSPSPSRSNKDVCKAGGRNAASSSDATSPTASIPATLLQTPSSSTDVKTTPVNPSTVTSILADSVAAGTVLSAGEGNHVRILLIASAGLSVILIVILVCIILYFNRRLKRAAITPAPTYSCTAYINPSSLDVTNNTSNNDVEVRGTERRPSSRCLEPRRSGDSRYTSASSTLRTIREDNVLPEIIDGNSAGLTEEYNSTPNFNEFVETGYEIRPPYQAAMLPSQLDIPMGQGGNVVQNPYFNSNLDSYNMAEPTRYGSAGDEDNDSLATEIEVEFKKTLSLKRPCSS